jgi:type II secretory pathway component PulK
VSRRPTHPTGFVLPLVLLLAMVVATVAALGLAQLSSQINTVARQVNTTQTHHAARGLADAVRPWLMQQTVTDIWDRLEADGHAMDLELSDGSTVRVTIADGQTALLGDLGSLQSSQDINQAGRALNELNRLVSEDRFRRLTRPVGPIAVSAVGAPEPVLRAAILAGVGDLDQADAVVAELLRLRSERSRLSRADIAGAINQLGADATTRAAVQRAVVAQPELWWVRAEVRRGSRTLGEFAGYFQARSQGRGATPGRFLAWAEVTETGPAAPPATTD